LVIAWLSGLTSLDEFVDWFDRRFSFIALQHAIQKPDDEAVYQKDGDAGKTGPLPNVPHFDWDQG
jgi:hypothetical protein